MHLGAAAARHQHDLDAGAQAGLHRAHALDRDVALAVVQQRGAAAEQRAVEVEVEAAHAVGARGAHAAVREASAGAAGVDGPGAAGRARSRPPARRRAAIVASTVRAIGVERRERLVAVAVLVEVDLRHARPGRPSRQTSISIAISTP